MAGRLQLAAKRKSVASSPNLPTKCMLIGSPALFQYSGPDMVGCPVTLKTTVQGRRTYGIRGNCSETPHEIKTKTSFLIYSLPPGIPKELSFDEAGFSSMLVRSC